MIYNADLTPADAQNAEFKYFSNAAAPPAEPALEQRLPHKGVATLVRAWIFGLKDVPVHD
ncbi:MAG: hypothetical protein ABIV50_00875 [Opitutus sp.]